MSQCAGSPRRTKPSTSMIDNCKICISLPTFSPRTGLMMSRRHKKSNQSNEYWELVMSMCMMSQSSSNCFRLSPWWYSLGICTLLLRVCTLQDIIDDRFGKTVEQRSPADMEGTLIFMLWQIHPIIVPMICLARLWAIMRATATSTTLALEIVIGLSTHYTWQPRHCTRHV